MAISREEVPEGKNEDNKTQTLLREDFREVCAVKKSTVGYILIFE